MNQIHEFRRTDAIDHFTYHKRKDELRNQTSKVDVRDINRTSRELQRDPVQRNDVHPVDGPRETLSTDETGIRTKLEHYAPPTMGSSASHKYLDSLPQSAS